jgi:uncharacterized protein (TIGR03085 family)
MSAQKHPTHSAAERAALVEAMRAAGPDAPTLCEGWTVRDLAAHLVIRERRPDAAAGIVVPPLRGWGDHVRRSYAAKPFDELLDLVADGPPITSGFALPGVDARLNLVEHFVHCEDVRRAAPGWTPRELPDSRQRAFAKMLSLRGKYFLRHSPVGVRLRTPDGQTLADVGDEPRITLTGRPAELVLYAFGRKDQAQVELDGPADALEAFRAMRLGV